MKRRLDHQQAIFATCERRAADRYIQRCPVSQAELVIAQVRSPKDVELGAHRIHRQENDVASVLHVRPAPLEFRVANRRRGDHEKPYELLLDYAIDYESYSIYTRRYFFSPIPYRLLTAMRSEPSGDRNVPSKEPKGP